MTQSDVVEGAVIGTGVNQQRLDTINGMRELCDFLAANPELEIPDWGVSLQVYGCTKQQLVNAVQSTQRKWRKVYWGEGMELRAEFSGDVSYGMNTKRDQVCERKVTGTEQRVIPAVEAKPERTEEVEVVEWVCSPLLGE